jgi:hypothetical protein
MKLTGIITIIVLMLTSCSGSKTVYLSNKTGGPITLQVDSSYSIPHVFAFKDSLSGLRIENKKVFDFGKGKWTKEDKAKLEELIKHIKIVKDGSETTLDMPKKTKVSLISFIVEELWVNIK